MYLKILALGLLAQDTTVVVFTNPLEAQNLGDLINNLINILFTVGLIIAPFMILFAGFQFLTSGGDPNKINTGKNILIYTFVGLIIILLSKGVTVLINLLAK